MFHSWNDIILLFCVCRWTNSLCSCMSWLTCWETSGFIDLQKVLSSFQANPAVSLLEQIASRLLRAFTVSDVCGIFCVAFCFVCLFCKCKSASKPGRILRKKSINGSNLICLIEKWVIYLDFFFFALSMLQSCATSEEVTSLCEEAQKLFRRIEQSRVPIVAAIHGSCLSRGLEVQQFVSKCQFGLKYGQELSVL